jgi:hypothetical protein
MKLSPQLASMLPASLPAGAAPSVRGGGAFAPAMEALIARLSSQAPVSAGIQGSPGGQVKIPVSARAVMPQLTPLDLTEGNQSKALIAADPDTPIPVAHEATESEIVSQSGPRRPMFPAENLEQQLPVPIAQNPVIHEASLKQSSAAVLEVHDVSGTGKSSREQHKADKMEPSDASNVATPDLVDTAVPLLQLFPQSVAAIAPQLRTLVAETGISKSSLQPSNGGFDTVIKKRAGAAVALPMPVNFKATASTDKDFARATPDRPEPEEIVMPADDHPPAPMHETSVAGQPAGQNISSGIAVHRPEPREITAWQNDQHSLKDAEKAVMIVAQSVAVEKAPVHASVATPQIQHQAAPNTPVPVVVTHRAQPLVEAHRVEASAAQVLQRMDTASPAAAVQLRVDARHLDVGVASGSLGWVEVRASVNPSGKVDAALHLETNASAHVVAAQSKEIADYARDHSVQLGQISVGVGTGDGSRGSSGSMQEPARNHHTAPLRRAVSDPASSETHGSAEKLSLISIRA